MATYSINPIAQAFKLSQNTTFRRLARGFINLSLLTTLTACASSCANPHRGVKVLSLEEQHGGVEVIALANRTKQAADQGDCRIVSNNIGILKRDFEQVSNGFYSQHVGKPKSFYSSPEVLPIVMGIELRKQNLWSAVAYAHYNGRCPVMNAPRHGSVDAWAKETSDIAVQFAANDECNDARKTVGYIREEVRNWASRQRGAMVQATELYNWYEVSTAAVTDLCDKNGNGRAGMEKWFSSPFWRSRIADKLAR